MNARPTFPDADCEGANMLIAEPRQCRQRDYQLRNWTLLRNVRLLNQNSRLASRLECEDSTMSCIINTLLGSTWYSMTGVC